LKRIIEGLKAQGKTPKPNELLEELKVATGCTESQLNTLRRAIRFPSKVLQEVDDGKLNWSHLIQIEASFTEAVQAKFPELLSEIGKKYARKVLIEKARQRILTSTRALMENVVPVITRAQTEDEQSFVKKLLRDFIEDEKMPAEQVLRLYERKYPNSGKNWAEIGKDIMDYGGYVSEMLDGVSTDMIRSYPKLTRDVQVTLHTLRGRVGKVLRLIGRVTE